MQGKVKEIRRIAGSQKPDLVFNYDGLGNRVSKTVIYPKPIDGAKELTTYYVRDAQGNILATYEKTKYENGDEKFYLKEQYLYGSSSATARLYRVVALKLHSMHNYKYDKIGNLVADKSEEIEEISWTMQGKVKEIRRTTGSQKPDLVFNYDGLGNRVSKTVINPTGGSDGKTKEITTYYIRDVQGNILAVYTKNVSETGDEEFYLTEQHLYGSSRIGMKVSNQLLASNVNGNVEIKEYDGYFTKEIGNKRYQLTNHLGNVLAVVSDKKIT